MGKNYTMEVLTGDITKLDVDVIVNAANESLLGGGGVDGAIHKAAGPELLEKTKTLGGCKTGEAVTTKGYNLPAKFIIHTVGPIYSGEPEDEILLENAYKNSLEEAKKLKVKKIAFPSISTGVYGYPKMEAASIAIKTVKEWLNKNHSDLQVIFCTFSAEDEEIYKEILGRDSFGSNYSMRTKF